jgi:hypothetical protein
MSGTPSQASTHSEPEPRSDMEPVPDEETREPRRWGAYLPWVVVVLAVVVAAMSTVQWLSLRGAAADRQAVTEVASDALMTVTNWQAGDLDAVRERLAELGTERLQEEAGQILDELDESLVAADASSRGEIIDLVSEARRGEGIAFALLVQQMETGELGTSMETCWSVRVVVIERAGRWLADQIDIYEGDCP